MHEESCDFLCPQAMAKLKNPHEKKGYTQIWRLQKPIKKEILLWNLILEWPNNNNKAHITLSNPSLFKITTVTMQETSCNSAPS